jgi:hypothetical protein
VAARCGSSDVRGAAGWRAAGRCTAYGADPPIGRWVRLPADVLHVVRRERTCHPVPRFYAIVMAASLVPATGLVAAGVPPRRALLGVPLLAWTGAFLWSLSSAFGRGRGE